MEGRNTTGQSSEFRQRGVELINIKKRWEPLPEVFFVFRVLLLSFEGAPGQGCSLNLLVSSKYLKPVLFARMKKS